MNRVIAVKAGRILWDPFCFLYWRTHIQDKKNIYKSDKGYVIGLFKVRETNDEKMEDYINKTVTFTGYFYDLNEDDTYIFYGDWVKHPRYGFQFQVSNYEKVKPTDKEGVVEFLSSDVFKGIGEKTAKKILISLLIYVMINLCWTLSSVG